MIKKCFLGQTNFDEKNFPKFRLKTVKFINDIFFYWYFAQNHWKLEKLSTIFLKFNTFITIVLSELWRISCGAKYVLLFTFYFLQVRNNNIEMALIGCPRMRTSSLIANNFIDGKMINIFSSKNKKITKKKTAGIEFPYQMYLLVFTVFLFTYWLACVGFHVQAQNMSVTISQSISSVPEVLKYSIQKSETDSKIPEIVPVNTVQGNYVVTLLSSSCTDNYW